MHMFNRRDTLAGMMAMGTLAMAQSPAAAASRQTFFRRVGLPIGLQVYTLGEEAGRDLDATFTQVAAIGYRDLELPSLYGRTPADIRRAADGAGVAISSLHLAAAPRGPAQGLTLANPVAEIADSLGTLGAKRAVLPIMPFPDNMHLLPGEAMQAMMGRVIAAAGADLWKRTAALLNERAAALNPLGIRLGYHNHNVEFAPIGQSNGWDILVRETDPRLVDFELDVGWVATAGRDPVDVLNSLKGRVAQLHVKDVARVNPVNFGLSMKPSDVGAGKLDWARILPAAYRAGVRHFYLEQEPPFVSSRMDAARNGYAYLSRLRA
ncbi:MAG: sugar phosphate isomerase/epimerase [Novosphingobium sp.]